jgi:hypothetical protein
MSLEDRVAAERIFKQETQVMVATEAAGEGINLQFCNLMINYDLPWNPNRLEQRMGRIHRYGQRKEVYVANLVAKDTREGKVMKKLMDKLNEIKTALNSDRVFDVIGEVFYGKDLAQLILDAAANARSEEEILKELDIKVDEEYIAKIKEHLGESLATHNIDFTMINEIARIAREQKLIPEYTRNFFVRAFSVAGGAVRERKDGNIAIDSIPWEIRNTADRDDIRKRFGSLIRSYSSITFDREEARRNTSTEFVTFGHPLFESVLDWVEEKCAPELQKGAVFTDPEGAMDGYIVFHEGEIRDGTGEIAGKRLFAHYVSRGNVTKVSPTILWKLAEARSPRSVPVNPDQVTSLVMSSVISDLGDYRNEIEKERARQAGIKEKYGLTSLRQLILELEGDLIELDERKGRGENVDIVIRNKKERQLKYQDAMKNLSDLIAKEREVTMGMPRLMGIIEVRPAGSTMDAMKRDPEVELAAMNFVMEYERNRGRTPEDVSAQDLGFDIRSKEPDGNMRYIEVKGRSRVGEVALTNPEWFKARELGNDYYLFVVFNATTSPEHWIVRNPANQLTAEKKVEVVRYIVGSEEIVSKGGK